MDLALCSGCRRHVRADEAACPFCGAAVREAAPSLPAAPHLSRSQRYAIGAALAAGALSACRGGSARSVDDIEVIEVAAPDAGSGRFATPPPTATATPTTTATARPNPTATGRPDPDDDWDGDRRRHRPPCGGPKGPCPPYGCVFPDEACDVVRA